MSDDTPPVVKGDQGRADHEIESGVFVWGVICTLLSLVILVAYLWLCTTEPKP